MAIKKSELYSSLWASCNELRGGMDASQYKDYVLTLLFVKYVSDKYGNQTDSLIEVPKGASFEDMINLKGTVDIGDKINKNILHPLFAANGLEGTMELVDFNDDDKLGSGKDKIETLSNLIAVFENPALNFKNNRAEDDDILGDAYEFLMRHFASESGKSKGQFYTPAEVSRILANIIEVNKADTPSFSVYDPTCGSGSLLLKVAAESQNGLTIYGQEKDIATKSLSIMNMWLHGNPEAEIASGNTLANPKFKEKDGSLKRYDFVVANPPFSVKSWNKGIDVANDEFNRFRGYGTPPDKNGDYAFLLHIVASLKSTGKGAVILPHGVLFRGNAEAEIRQNLLERKLIKGIIGLPANLFYGTGIPACIIVIDKENALEQDKLPLEEQGLFMIDASKGFIKDGNKNRLREQDIHKVIDTFNEQIEVAKYARFIPYSEIEDNEYNLNIPRYIDTQEEEEIQDLTAHLNGGLPNRDIEGLNSYWAIYPNLKNNLFTPISEEYSKLNVPIETIKNTIYSHPEFVAYNNQLKKVFTTWQENAKVLLTGINENTAPKLFITELSESLLQAYHNKPLVDDYKIYQHLMDYWESTLKDDVYMVVEEGFTAKVKRIVEKNKRGTEVDKGWTCDLLPKQLVIDTYLNTEQQALVELQNQLENTGASITTMQEEYSSEGALLEEATNDKGVFTKATLTAFVKVYKSNISEVEAITKAKEVLALFTKETNLKKEIKTAEGELDSLLLKQYSKLTTAEVQDLVVNHKWLAHLQNALQTEVESISQSLTTTIKTIAERYSHTLTELNQQVEGVETQVNKHLQKMGLVW